MNLRFQFAVKRSLDVIVAGAGLLFLLPVLGIVALAIKLESAGPAFFRLRVAGRCGLPFEQWKFRTMVHNARELGHRFETSADDSRITRVGRFLRRWSLDELPQLWNVLRGDMSLVGPRPTFPEVAERYSLSEARRLGMRPGLTGWAQIHGRNLVPWPRRVELDLEYIDRYSLWLDLSILWRTVPVWFRGQGVYGEGGQVCMHEPVRIQSRFESGHRTPGIGV